MFDSNTVVAFGLNKNSSSYLIRIGLAIKVRYFSDNNDALHWTRPMGDDRVCIPPEKILELKSPLVIIMADKPSSVKDIESQLRAMNVYSIRIKEILKQIDMDVYPDLFFYRQYRINKFLDLELRESRLCNFHCSYCSSWRKKAHENKVETSLHSCKEIRRALAIKRIGLCFINICARGETLLSRDVVELVQELLEEGHYVSIVTNGTITQKIEELTSLPQELQKRLFFKLSFHYMELKKKNWFDLFFHNVDMIKNSSCSYTLEITPHDELVEEIDDIKALFNTHANGAMPHITFARDSTKEKLDVLTNYDLQEYKKIWSPFDSRMFDLKSRLYGKKITQYCYAGRWSYLINLYNGDIRSCYHQPVTANIFENMDCDFPILTIGHDCKMSYCFNNHAFVAWGTVPKIRDYNYFDMRDRTDKDGNHWVKPPMSLVMNNQLFDNNFHYADRWNDYERLFASDRKPSFILFNSPDYKNLGDHAIALSEKQFFSKYFSDRDFIEVACDEYAKENVLVKKAIREDDILLITGGGNIGSLYIRINDMALDVINSFPNNKIIIMPQSIYFESNPFGEEEKLRFQSVVSSHKQLMIFAREKFAYDVIEKMVLPDTSKYLAPDMAFCLAYTASEHSRDGCLLCLRDDKEATNVKLSLISEALAALHIRAGYVSTLATEDVCLSNREAKVRAILDRISSAKLVITDRLHCMIFCAVTNTPCLAFDNLSNKVFGSYQWIKNMGIVVAHDDKQSLKAEIQKLLSRSDEHKNIFQELSANFEQTARIIKEFIE